MVTRENVFNFYFRSFFLRYFQIATIQSECDSLSKFFSKLSITLLEDIQEGRVPIYPEVTKIDRKHISEQKL